MNHNHRGRTTTEKHGSFSTKDTDIAHDREMVVL